MADPIGQVAPVVLELEPVAPPPASEPPRQRRNPYIFLAIISGAIVVLLAVGFAVIAGITGYKAREAVDLMITRMNWDETILEPPEWDAGLFRSKTQIVTAKKTFGLKVEFAISLEHWPKNLEEGLSLIRLRGKVKLPKELAAFIERNLQQAPRVAMSGEYYLDGTSELRMTFSELASLKEDKSQLGVPSGIKMKWHWGQGGFPVTFEALVPRLSFDGDSKESYFTARNIKLRSNAFRDKKYNHFAIEAQLSKLEIKDRQVIPLLKAERGTVRIDLVDIPFGALQEKGKTVPLAYLMKERFLKAFLLKSKSMKLKVGVNIDFPVGKLQGRVALGLGQSFKLYTAELPLFRVIDHLVGELRLNVPEQFIGTNSSGLKALFDTLTEDGYMVQKDGQYRTKGTLEKGSLFLNTRRIPLGLY